MMYPKPIEARETGLDGLERVSDTVEYPACFPGEIGKDHAIKDADIYTHLCVTLNQRKMTFRTDGDHISFITLNQYIRP